MKFCENCFFTFVVHVLIFCPFVLSFALSHCSFYPVTHYRLPDLHFFNVSVISDFFFKLARLATDTIVPKIYILEPSHNSVFVRYVIFTNISVADFCLSLDVCLEILHKNTTHTN